MNRSKCTWAPLGERLGTGKKASTYKVCCGSDCLTFAVKIQENRLNRSDFYDTIKKEVVLQDKFAKLGIAPEVYDAFMCNNKESYIVMDRLDMDIDSYSKYLVQNTNFSFEQIDAILDTICDTAISLMRIAHSNKLVHTDLNPGNIMVKLSNDPVRTPIATKIVDFGNGPKEVFDEKEADREEDLHGITMTFDMIKRNIRNLPRGDNEVAEILIDDFSTPIKAKRPSFESGYDTPIQGKRLRFFDDDEENLP
jgi:serine/threonine protein kinase